MTTAFRAKIEVRAEHLVKAPADEVYRYIADYREHHPHFLPRAFSNLTVEKGGIGTGTVFSFDLRVAGRTTRMRVTVDEPDPGSVIKEISLESDHVTTFEVIPQGQACIVRIHSEWTPADGLQGWLERRIGSRKIAELLHEELINLDLYAGAQSVARNRRELTRISAYSLR